MKIENNPISFSKILGNRHLFTVLIIVSVVLGLIHIFSSWSAYKQSAEEHAIKMAQAAEAFISTDLINSLDVSLDDISKPEYRQLKNSILLYKERTEGVEFAYLYTLINGKVYFMVDSEPEDSTGYSPPGQEYYEATAEYISPFLDDAYVFTDPTTDRWGTWVSALIPIKDFQTGKTIAVFGVDYSAAHWNAEIISKAMNPLVIVISILLLFVLLYRNLVKNFALKALSNKLKESETLFRTVYEQVPVGIAIIDNHQSPSAINAEYQQILGRSIEELRTISWRDITHPDDLKEGMELYAGFKAGEIENYELVTRFLKKDGSYIWVHMTIVRLQGKGNNQKHLCILKDINRFILAEEALLESERSKSVLLSHLPGLAYRCNYDRAWTMQYLSDGCYALTGYKPENLLNNNDLTFNEIIAPEYRETLWTDLNHDVDEMKSYRVEYEIITATGERKWVLELGQGLIDNNNKVAALEGIIIDISESKQQLLQIQYMIDHDFMTDLYNRRYYEDTKNNLDKEENYPLSMIIADINGLRLINDAFGHTEGDQIIIETSKILRSCIRKDDILARIGGDEFSILLPNTDSNAVNDVYCAIKRACDLYNQSITEKSHYISLSMGYGTKTENNKSIDEVEKEAEDFMIKSKLLERKSLHNSILSTIMATMYTRSQETEEHAERLFEVSRLIGDKMGLSGKTLDDLQLFSMLHDIGKVGIDDRILNKPGKLNNEEWVIMKKHPELGYRIAITNPELESIAEYILSHHERWDGKGYPRGLAGEKIPLLARILAVADAYDAMTEDRVYRKAMEKDNALEEIRNNSGTQFDPEIVDVFLEVI